MVLKDRLYRIRNISANPQQSQVDIGLIRESDIYRGHFPSQPITPGVALVQMAVELASAASQNAWGDKNELSLRQVSGVKFFRSINPEEIPSIRYTFTPSDNGVTKVTVEHDGITLAKMNLKLI